MSFWNNSLDLRKSALMSLSACGLHIDLDAPATQFITRSRKGPSPLDSEASMHYEGTHLAKSGVSPASSAKLSAPPQPSQSRPKKERTAQGGQRDMTLT